MAPQKIHFIYIELKHEIRGKALEIPLYGAVEIFRFNSIKLGKIHIKHHFMASNEINLLLNVPEFRRL